MEIKPFILKGELQEFHFSKMKDCSDAQEALEEGTKPKETRVFGIIQMWVWSRFPLQTRCAALNYCSFLSLSFLVPNMGNMLGKWNEMSASKMFRGRSIFVSWVLLLLNKDKGLHPLPTSLLYIWEQSHEYKSKKPQGKLSIHNVLSRQLISFTSTHQIFIKCVLA